MTQKEVEKLAWGVAALGALISSVSILEDPNVLTSSGLTGIEYHPALLSPHGLMLGNAIFVSGLALQFIAQLENDEKVKSSPYIYIVLAFLVFSIFLLQSALQRIFFV
ncbi:MAG: hypothetical protein Q8O83_00825 [bacterium]|nr:hypothetical protein [bacterium]